MKQKISENIKLKSQLSKAKKKIKLQQQVIKDLNNNYLLNSYIAIEKATNQYDILLNPYPVKIKAVYKGKSETFEVKVTNVLCICSDKITKYIYLRHPITSIDNEFRKTVKIEVNKNFKSLCKEIDSLEFHLFQQSKTSAVNLNYYSLNKNELILNINEYSDEPCKRLKIGEPQIEEFTKKQKEFRRIISFQKKKFRSIV